MKLFELPNLPYEKNALEPHINKQTIEYHYGKHHQAYVNNLNNLVPGTAFEGKDLEYIVKNSEGGIFNNAAQIWNHTFYFHSFSPKGGGEPSGKVAELIKRDFGSFEDFKAAFNKAAATLFGSGWVWLVLTNEGKLSIVQEGNAGCPLTKGLTPILTMDVWEHAYYLDYQNKRPEYIDAFWHVVDWDVVNSRI